jgi:hypothetical protein
MVREDRQRRLVPGSPPPSLSGRAAAPLLPVDTIGENTS